MRAFGDGTNQGTSSGAVIRINSNEWFDTVFGLTAGTDTTIHSAGAGYTFGTVNLEMILSFQTRHSVVLQHLVLVLVVR